MPFNYTPYRSPFTNSIAETMLRKGDAAARAAEQTGQIYGQAIQSIGQTVNSTIQQANDPQRKMAQTQVSDLAALDKAFTLPGGRDAILSALPGHLRPQVMASFASADENAAKVNEANLKAEAATTDYIHGLAEDIKAHGYEPAAAQLALSHAKQTFASNPSLVNQVRQIEAQIQQPNVTTDAIKGLIDPILAAHDAKEKPVVLPGTPRGGAPAQLVKPGSGAVVATGSPAQAAAPTQAELALRAANGDPAAQAAMAQLKPPPVDSSQVKDVLLDGKPAQVLVDPKKPGTVTDLSGKPIADPAAHIRPIPPAAQANAAQNTSEASMIADAIVSGDQPPDVKGLYRLAGPIRAELAKRGYDMTKANLDWEATKKHLSTLNGAQQTRLRQAIGTASDSLGVIEDLAQQWDGGKFPILNKANLALAKNGVLGPKAQQIATNLTAQITDVTSELGNVYMGGNSPTDHALGLAQQNLSADWTKDQLLSAIKLARTNLQIRQNSITNSGAVLSGGPADTKATTAPKFSVGDTVQVGAKRIKISAIHPDGTFDGAEVK